MNKYIFNARDIAAYFKWFSIPNYLEVSYMQYIFSLGTIVLAKPLTKDFESFKSVVYRELYYLWANGFEGEKSDIANMTPDGAMALICDQECIELESYMKLIKLHLIFSKYLPYVKINFAGLPLSLGLRCEFSVFEENVVKVVEGLDLVCKDCFEKPFDLNKGVPDELLSISLSPDFKKQLMNGDIRTHLRASDKKKMQEYKDKSIELESENNNLIKKHITNASNSKLDDKTKEENPKVDSTNQPKGAPLENKGSHRG